MTDRSPRDPRSAGGPQGHPGQPNSGWGHQGRPPQENQNGPAQGAPRQDPSQQWAPGQSSTPGQEPSSDQTILRSSMYASQNPRPTGSAPSSYSHSPTQSSSLSRPQPNWPQPGQSTGRTGWNQAGTQSSASAPQSAQSAAGPASAHSASAPASAHSASAPASASPPPGRTQPPGGQQPPIADRFNDSGSHSASHSGGSDGTGSQKGSHKVTTGDGETLNVPLPGHKLSDTRSRARLLRGLSVGALVLALLLTAGVGAFLATLATRDGGPGPAGTTATEEWNTDAGAAMGSRYLRMCLMRFADEGQEKARFDQLSAMNAATDETCGAGNANSGGPGQNRTVSSVTFTGVKQPVSGIPNARFLSFAANTSDGELGYMVPVYLDDPIAGTGPRVIGKSGIVNVGGYGVPAGPEQPPVTDPELASELETKFLPEFFTAWTGSTDSLQQFLSSDATESARDGLNQRLADPKLDKVTVLPPPDAGEPGSYDYTEGMRVTVETTLTATHHRGASMASAYRVTLVRTGDKWFVADVEGALADVPANAGSPTAPPEPEATP